MGAAIMQPTMQLLRHGRETASRMKRQLHSARLLLRPPQPGDEQAVFHGWAQDLDVLRYLAWPPARDLAHTQARWLKHSAWTWLLMPHGGTPIGLVQLLPLQLDGPVHHLRLGYLLARAHWGQGLMQEAVQAALDAAWADPALCRIDALCDVDNPASARLLQRLGFEQEGRLRRHSRHPNVSESPRDVTLHARVRDPVRAAGP